MMKITALSHLFEGQNLNNGWLTKYLLAHRIHVGRSHHVKNTLITKGLLVKRRL